MKYKTIVFFSAIVIAGLVFGVLVASNFISFGGSAGEWPDYTNADSLVKESDRIVIAQYLDESPYSKVGRRRVTPVARSTFPSAPFRTGRAAFTASGSPVSLQW